MTKVVLPLPPSSNQAYPTDWKTGRRFLSRKALAWRADALEVLKPVSEKYDVCHITLKFYFPDKRIRDIFSYHKLAVDTVVMACVIPDDNWMCVPCATLEGSLDREYPRLEIYIKAPEIGGLE